MPRLFVSYSRTDALFLQMLVPLLRTAYGLENVWFDEQIPGGVDWWQMILREIDACQVFVFLMSNDSLLSTYCQDECREAIKKEKFIVPLVVRPKTDIWGNMPPDLKNALRKINYTDLSGGILDAAATAKLYRAISQHQKPGETGRKSSREKGYAPTPIAKKDRGTPSKKRSNVGDFLPDPFEWCEIPAGHVFISDASTHFPPGTKGGEFLVSAFHISKYPVTHAQFDVFVNAEDGYDLDQWWAYSTAALEWRRASPKPKVVLNGCLTCPRTDVSWYEAVAYCGWLSSKLKTVIRLPTEQQWQWAAQGDDDRLYPWGNMFDSSRLQFKAQGPAPVNQHNTGASPFGVMDMCGNVMEWCLTSWVNGSNDLVGHGPRVLRGGSWQRSDVSELSAKYRTCNFPNFRADNRGFRIAKITN